MDNCTASLAFKEILVQITNLAYIQYASTSYLSSWDPRVVTVSFQTIANTCVHEQLSNQHMNMAGMFPGLK